MVEFKMYGDPVDYSGSLDADESKIEAPIIPIHELGTTMLETDPRTGAHILQNIEANIRKGVSVMQLMWQTPSGSAIGGRPKAYGKEVREAIREMLEANEVRLVGAELPTSSNSNMSGYDPQSGAISEQKRLRDLQEVKDVIDFQVDVAGGGGVDIWSQEYARTIADNNKINDPNSKFRFYDTRREELLFEEEIQKKLKDPTYKMKSFDHIDTVKPLYDKERGQGIGAIKKSTIIHSPKYMTAKDFEADSEFGGKSIGRYDANKAKAEGGDGKIKPDDLVDVYGNWINKYDEKSSEKRVPLWDKASGTFETEDKTWVDIVRDTQEYNKRKGTELNPEEYMVREQINAEVTRRKGDSRYFSQEYEQTRRQLKKITELEEEYKQKEKELQNIFKDDKEGLKFALEQENKNILSQMSIGQKQAETIRSAKDMNDTFGDIKRNFERALTRTHEQSATFDAQAREQEERKDNIVSPDRIAKENTLKSYAELGIYAMEKSKDPKVKHDVYVGPELGWPTAFGGHPEEFIEIISKAREKMVDQLTDKNSPFYREHMDKSEAKEYAKKHIRGDFDTGHLAMWYNHFDSKPGEPEEKKIKRFNEWYMDMVDKMQKADVIGSIQVVDSMNGQHAHLPPGQGIFPVVDAVKRLKDKGWKGDIVSEGHEEEKFGNGRMITETWKAFGGSLGTGNYWGPKGNAGRMGTWGGVQSSYFGATQSPTYIVGGYVPSNEWSLWSETPFE